MTIFLIIILIASYVGVFFVMSFIDLFNTKDVYEVNINVAGQLLTIENSINGIIPTGNDYYYVGVDDNKGDIYAIHAGKHWLEDNFDANGVAHGNSITVKGLSKRASDFEVEKDGTINLVAHEQGQTTELKDVTYKTESANISIDKNKITKLVNQDLVIKKSSFFDKINVDAVFIPPHLGHSIANFDIF